jgi:hypothetical protein
MSPMAKMFILKLLFALIGNTAKLFSLSVYGEGVRG